MSYAMFCATHGPQYSAPCPTCGAWHTDPEPKTPPEHDKLKNAIDAVRDTGPDYEHARAQMEGLGIAVSIADAARDAREAANLGEYSAPGHTWASWLEEQADATDRAAPPEMRYFTITSATARRIASQLRRLRTDAYIATRLDERPGSYGWIYDTRPPTVILAEFRDSWIAHARDESVEATSIEDAEAAIRAALTPRAEPVVDQRAPEQQPVGFVNKVDVGTLEKMRRNGDFGWVPIFPVHPSTEYEHVPLYASQPSSVAAPGTGDTTP